MPDDIAYIARRRAEGAQEKQIAAELGVSSKTLWGRVSSWNHRHPDNPVPRPACRPAVPFYVQVAEMKKSGLSNAEIARRIKKSESRTEQLLAVARDHRLLPLIRPSNRNRGGVHTLEYYRNKRACPKPGCIADVFALLTADQVTEVLDMARQKDTLADVLARVLKEHLDAKTLQK